MLEIGAGTGIATEALVQRAFHVTALEPGAAMAAIIARNLGPTGHVDVRIGRLEDLEWLAALLYYQHVAGGDMALFEAAQQCYEEHAPSIAGLPLRETEDEIPSARALDGMPWFSEWHRQRWLHQVASDRAHYLALLSTYSSHLTLPGAEREALLACIGDLLDGRFGGRIVKGYRYCLVEMQRDLRAHPESSIASLVSRRGRFRRACPERGPVARVEWNIRPVVTPRLQRVHHCQRRPPLHNGRAVTYHSA